MPTHDSEHDKVFRALLATIDALPRWLPPMLPPTLASLIDWTTLSLGAETTIDARRRRRKADAVFHCRATRGEDLLLVLQLEHQARPDPDMPRRMLEMAVARMGRGRRAALPSIVSVVFYQGPERWTGPRSLSEQRGHDEPTPGMVHLEPVFIDLARLPPEQLPSEDDDQTVGLRFTLELMAVARQPDLWAQVARRARMLGRLREGLLRDHVLGYIQHVASCGPTADELATIDGALAGEGSNMGAWMEQLIQEGKAQGRVEGIERGEASGAVRTLRRALQRRFGALSEVHEERLQQATLDDVDRLVERLFTARSLDELFAG
jgi:hypothetical protein